MTVILLAAGVGRRFGKQTKKTPKCLIPLTSSGDNLLKRYLDTFRALRLRDIVIVVGHQRHLIKNACRKNSQGLWIRFLFNQRYKKGSLVSLYTARHALKNGALVMDADVFFPERALKKLLLNKAKTAFLVDRRSKATGEEMMLMAKSGRPYAISKKIDPSLKILGESIGFLKIGKPDARILVGILGRFVRQGILDVEYEEAYNVLMKQKFVRTVPIGNLFWTEMDFVEDLKKIKACLNK